MARRLREPVAARRGAPAAAYPDAPAAGHPHDPAAPTGAYGAEIPPGLLKPRNGAGRAALVFGVLALLCTIGFFLLVTVPVAIVLGLLAILLGLMGRSRVRRGLATNRGSATLGIVTGLLSLLILAGLAIGGVALLSHHKADVTNFKDCVQQAGSNTQKVQDCATQFKNQVTK